MSLKALLSEWHTPPPTPTLLGQKSSSNESAELVNQYKRLYHEIQRLITRIRGKKLYSCDTHEVYSCYGFKKNFWIDDLNDDKLLLALNAAALEEVRVDALQ